jgi:hypothetical protein
MNRVPGKSRAATRLTGAAAGLLLLLPLFASAQPVAPGMPGMVPAPGVPGAAPLMPGYYPGPMVNPYYPLQIPATGTVPGTNGQLQPGQQTVQQPIQQPVLQPGQPIQQPRAFNPWARPRPPGAPVYQPAPVQSGITPYLEVSVESTRAYVHQNLVMTIQVVSPVNLKTVSAEIPDTDDVMLRQLGKGAAKVSTRTRQGQREIVNTMYYQLTPLRSGRIELESLTVSGLIDDGTPNPSSYEAVATLPVELEVMDPEPGVLPWLPLQELELSASLSNDERIGEGEPLTLTVEQSAVGMSGAQLPSLEKQLQGPGHRLYREKTEHEGTITKEGSLIGKRMDRYTLVPTQGNEVNIPAIRVDWWNVERRRKETAVLPARLLNELARPQSDKDIAVVLEKGEATVSVLVWIISLAVAFMLGRFWPRLAPALQRTGFWIWQWLYTVTRPMHQPVQAMIARLSPRRNMHLLRRKVANSLPLSARMWFCVRNADEEQDADDWSQVLRFLVNRRLGLSANLPMSKLAEHIIEIHPGADPARIRALLSELDAALFANRPIRDFNRWKKEFKYQVRPRPFAWLRYRQRYLRVGGLPGLNPSAG